MHKTMVSEARLKLLKKMIILGPKTAILGPQFCRILVLGPHFWWSGGGGAGPGSAPDSMANMKHNQYTVMMIMKMYMSESLNN